jgi:opacity protein-like surface antigen
MRPRIATLFVLGAALSLEAASASAQVRSQRRIPVTKEAPSTVAPPRVDTVTVFRTDTLRIAGPARVDTVRTTTMMHDTVRVEVPVAAALRKIGGFYWGLAAGGALPAANFNDPNKPGWRIDLPFGIDPIGSPLGLRVDLGYSNNSTHSWIASRVDNAQIMNADLDLKWRLGQATMFDQGFQFYALGGATYNRFKDVVRVNKKTGPRYRLGDDISSTLAGLNDHSWEGSFGWVAGGGAQVAWGAANIFSEIRYSRVGADSWPVAHVPLIFGVAFY